MMNILEILGIDQAYLRTIKAIYKTNLEPNIKLNGDKLGTYLLN